MPVQALRPQLCDTAIAVDVNKYVDRAKPDKLTATTRPEVVLILTDGTGTTYRACDLHF